MTVLDKIIAHKKREVEFKKRVISVQQLERSDLFNKETISFSEAIVKNSGIIAEHKRKSPSKPTINSLVTLEEIVTGYENSGASALSILTDTHFFGGSLDDLLFTRSLVKIPILRKDFIVDPYQILEAKSNGADAILLIASALSKHEIVKFSTLAQSISLEVLLEVHNNEELQKAIVPSLNAIGVNNRNLKTFKVSLENSYNLVHNIPDEFVKVSESGLQSSEDILALKKIGFQGFLIGETFMKTSNPSAALSTFLNEINSKNI